MRLLLDTHVLIWLLAKSDQLSPRLLEAIHQPGASVLFSVASIWEIAIKAALGRADFNVSPRRIVDEAIQSGLVEIPVRSSAALRVAGLPLHHRDPFDRLLIAQAIDEEAQLLTADAALALYGPNIFLLA